MSRARSPRASAKKHASNGVHGSLLGKHTKAVEPRHEHAGAETRPLHNAKPLWEIRGRKYDLEEFLPRHPGGRELLEMVRGKGDITETFELHHPLADPERMDAILAKYDVGPAERRSDAGTFEPDGFYRTLSARVRDHFKSQNIDHHAPTGWYIKAATQTVLMLGCAAVMSGALPLEPVLSTEMARALQLTAAALTGHIFIQCGFTIMHDASHHAISRNAAVNEWLSRIWCSAAWWQHSLWTQHHVLEHHSYTGDPGRDPDVIHLKPLVRKSDSSRASGYFRVPRPLRAAWVVLATCIFPGSAVGQALLYNFQWIRRGYLWRMSLPDLWSLGAFKVIFDIVVKLGHVAAHWWMGDLMVSIVFLLALNFTYAACLLPDHDTIGTYEHHHDSYQGSDWGATQVWNSASWSVGSAFTTELFGGINMQIEHHLFPTVSHSHHRAIHPIVERTCKEFGVAYTEYPSTWSAICAVVQNLVDRMDGEEAVAEDAKSK